MPLKLSPQSEEDLILGCLRNEATAQRKLYELHSPKMYSVCCRYVKDRMQAQDVLITGFTKIFDKISQFKSEGSFEGWIRRVIVNEALTFLRKQRTMYVESDLEEAERKFDNDQSGDQLEAEDLLKMIDELPPGYRVVFNMYAIDGYSHKEIAEHLGISENTSKSQLSRARVFLQNLLAQRESYQQKIYYSNEASSR